MVVPRAPTFGASWAWIRILRRTACAPEANGAGLTTGIRTTRVCFTFDEGARDATHRAGRSALEVPVKKFLGIFALLGAACAALMFWRKRQEDDEFLDEELE